jgi:hypothetical protein
MKQRVRFRLISLPLLGVLLSATSLVRGQTVTFEGTAVNFGDVFICTPGTTTPAPCRETLTLNYRVTTGGTLGTPKVLTQGAPYLDFMLAGSTCTGQVTTGSACIVRVTLAPKFPGLRAGAVQIIDGSGKVLATTFLRGVGLGPQLAINGASPDTLVSNPNPNIFWSGIAVDGAGNVFFPNGERGEEGVQPAVFELPAAGGAVRTVGSGFSSPQGVAVDGAGNVYVTDIGYNMVVEVPLGCADTSCQIMLDGGFDFPYGVAVDGAGNVYVADSLNNRVVEMPAGCTTRSCDIPVGSGLKFPFAVAVDATGNVFIADSQNQRVVKVPAGGGAQSTVVSNVYADTVAVDAAGDLFITNNDTIVEAPAGGGGLITLARGAVQGVTLDAAGNLFFTNFSSSIVVSELRRTQLPVNSFANTAVGTVSGDSPRAYTVQNGGDAPLSVTGLTVGTDANFVQVAGPEKPGDCKFSFSLAPGASCDLSISFTPTVNGPLAGAAVLTDNTLNQTNATQVVPLAGTGGPAGPAITFSDGFSSAAPGLLLNGGAAIRGTVLQLTDGGPYEIRSAFFPTRVGLESFTTAFDFQLTGNEGLAPTPDADGFTFVLQANGPDALGSAGGGLGYGLPAIGQPGAKIDNSIAVKFDLHNNEGEGASSTGLYLNGAAPTIPSINLLPSGIDLHSGHVFHVVLVYDGSTLTLTIEDETTRATFSEPFRVNIPALLGGQTGYAGFTASTGLKTAVQSILNWQLVSSDCCMTGVPGFSSGFSGASGLTLNGATISGGALLLTQATTLGASSAYFSTPVPVNKFTSDFDFKMSRGDGDGFTFVLQSEGLHAVGPGGGGLGYGPPVPGGFGGKIAPSVAVKFDRHSDAGEGSNSTGLYVGGASPTVPWTDLGSSGINLHSGHAFHARLSYDAVHLTVSITDLTQYAVFNGTYVLHIPTAVRATEAYAGFTASTGSSTDTVKILNWNMSTY